MKRFLYSKIKLQPLAVFLFILLNCLFTAAPFVQANPANNYSLSAPLHLGGNDLEENLRIGDISLHRQELRINSRVVLNKVSISHFSLQECMVATILTKQDGQHFFWLRPGYYSFLSLFNLF